MLEHETDHLSRILDLLPMQYRQDEVWEALMVRMWAPETQRQEDALQSLIDTQFDWTQATGYWLEMWGELAQLPRPDAPEYLDDDIYRRAIDARFHQWRSEGSGEELIQAAMTLLPGATIHYTALPPRCVQLDIYQLMTPAERGVAAAILYAMAPLPAHLSVVEDVGDGWGMTIIAPDLEVNLRARENDKYSTQPQITIPDLFRLGELRIGMLSGGLVI